MMPSVALPPSAIEGGLLHAIGQNVERLVAVGSAGIVAEDFVIWGKVYGWQREHLAKYSALPTQDQISARWPDWEPPSGEFAYWLSEMKRTVMVRKAAAILRAGLEQLGDDPASTISETMAQLGAIRAAGNPHMSDSDESAPDRFAMYERRAALYQDDPSYLIGIPSGFDAVDATHIGWCPSEFIGFYARPTTGKTWMLVREGAIAWSAGRKVMMVSPEMSAHQIELREDVFKARAMGVQLSHQGIFKGDPAQREAYRAYTEAVKDEKRWWTFDSWAGKAFSVSDIKMLAEQLEPDMILIDGLSLLRSDRKRDDRARWERMAESCEELKHFATAADIVIMGSHQSVNTNRGRRGDRDAAGGRGDDWVMPSLSDAADGDALVRNCSSIFTMCPDRDMENLRWYSVRKTRERYMKFQPRLGLLWDVDSGRIEDLGQHGDNLGAIRSALVGAA